MNKKLQPKAAPAPGGVLSPNLAAQMLWSCLGESETVWGFRLTNWRRPERKSPITWHEKPSGRPYYLQADVQAYVDAILAARAAATGPDTGPGQARANAIAEVTGARPFVQVVWNAGAAQGAFNLSIEAAKNLAQKLDQQAVRAEDVTVVRLATAS